MSRYVFPLLLGVVGVAILCSLGTWQLHRLTWKEAMLADIETRMPGRKDAMLRALGHTNPSHLLDPKLFDFSSLETVRRNDD